MKLIGLNTSDGKYYKEIVDFLKEENPDIVALQEIYSSPSMGSNPLLHNNKTLNFHQYLLSNLDYKYTYFSPVLKTKMDTLEGLAEDISMGNLILSKHPIKESNTHFFYLDYNDNFEFPEPGISFTNQPRNFQKVNISTPEGDITLINLHGIWKPNHFKEDSEDSDRMVDILLKNIDVNRPTILTGDFNLSPNTEGITRLKYLLKELVTEKNVLTTRSNIANSKIQIVDYMFVSKGIDVSGFEVRELEISDHLPMILTFDLH